MKKITEANAVLSKNDTAINNKDGLIDGCGNIYEKDSR